MASHAYSQQDAARVHPRLRHPDAMIIRPLPDGSAIVFDQTGDAIGHPSTFLQPQPQGVSPKYAGKGA